MEIHGTVAPGFERVRDAFGASFTRHGDVGAACCVYRHGAPVVDLWGGLADREIGRAWQADTPVITFSATKGVTAICAHLLAERGQLDLDAPVARYWPEFAAAGKGGIPVRWLLSHRAGLAEITADLTLEEALAWAPVIDALARQAPVWEPGTKHGYHMRSYGWLVGEVLRRVTGRTVGRFFADEIAAPLGLEYWIGLPAAIEPRVATLYPAPPPDPATAEMMAKFMGRDTLTGRVATGPSNRFHYDDMWNRRALRAAELPSSNGVGTARALARLYAACVGDVDGIRVLRPDTVAAACVEQSDGPDAVLLFPTRFGTGFMLPPTLSLAAHPGAFGHPGAGGSLAMGDRDAGLSFAYVMNQMRLGITGDPRAQALLAAVYDSL